MCCFFSNKFSVKTAEIKLTNLIKNVIHFFFEKEKSQLKYKIKYRFSNTTDANDETEKILKCI